MTLQRPARSTLRRARDLMLERGEVPLGRTVSSLIARSWRRSAKAGLSPGGRLADVWRLDVHELAQARQQRRDLIAHARPVMEYLHLQTRHSESLVTLADDRGLLLQALGDSDFLSRAERVALVAGASWHERDRGTNAIGTALSELRPLVVVGGEHFLERNGFLSCAAAPLFAPDGRVLGVLDISGDERRYHPHTLGLVRAAAQTVENRLFDSLHARHLRLRFHTMAEGIGTFSEGIAALSDEGSLIGANLAGRAFRGLRCGDLQARPLSSILPVRLEDLLDWNRRRPGEPMLVTLADDERLFMRIELPAGAGARVLAAGDRKARARNALDALDTGDERLAAAIEKAHKLIGKPIPLLLQGEHGVGKERFARALHDSGPRHDGPFVRFSGVGLSPEQIEATLFGPATGSGPEGPQGAVQQAHGGTLFIDHVELLPLSAQVRLLDLATQGHLVAKDATQSVPSDAVLICATHSNLRAAIEAGVFDVDFYYRINGLTLQLAPLRERKDLAALVARLLEELEPGRGVALEPEVAWAFAEYAWPGNLRQLHNALHAAVALLDDGQARIGWSHLPDDLVEELKWRVPRSAMAVGEVTENLRELSLATIERAVALARGNMSEAARRLGISRNTLYRRLPRSGRPGDEPV